MRHDALAEAFLYQKAIDKDAYDAQLKKLRAEEHAIAAALGELEEEEPYFEAGIAVAREVLADPADFWLQAEGMERVRYQRFVFPEGVRFDGETFGTAVTSPVFGWLRSLGSEQKRVVNHSIPSWNQVREWLLELDTLRRGIEGASGTPRASA